MVYLTTYIYYTNNIEPMVYITLGLIAFNLYIEQYVIKMDNNTSKISMDDLEKYMEEYPLYAFITIAITCAYVGAIFIAFNNIFL
jgi:hypothetical protein